MPANRPSHQAQTFTVRGELQSASFLPWAQRHCQRLGLRCETLHADATEVIFQIDGQADLMDAFEVGCLLGPFDVWVDSITRSALTSDI